MGDDNKLLPSILVAGSGLIGQGINAASTAANNKKARRHAVWRYDVERQDSLNDWAMQNSYNHPSSQMARLREAGLNPNLAYGNGATATSNQAVQKTSTDAWSPEAPQVNLPAVTGAYFDTEMKQAQIDNLRVQNDIMKKESTLKSIAAMIGMVDFDSKDFDLGVKKELRDTTIETVKWEMQKLLTDISKTEADTVMTTDSNRRAESSNSAQLRESAERILTSQLQRAKTDDERKQIQQQIQLLKSENIIKAFDAELTKLGIRPGDKIGWRLAAKVMKNLGIIQ